MQMTRLPALLLSISLLFILGGCSSYQYGTGGKLSFKSIYIAPVKNDSFAPQAQALITKQIIQALLQEGSLRVSNEASADATLEVNLTHFGRKESSVQSVDTQRARAYDIQLNADCTLTDNNNGKKYFKNRVLSATINSFVDDGLQSAEYQNMPILTQKLAHKIRDTIISTW